MPEQQQQSNPRSIALTSIGLVGSGDLRATPHTGCLLSGRPCPQCATAQQDPHSICCRSQTSLLLSFSSDSHILVDCGSTFRDALLACVRRFVVARKSAQSSACERNLQLQQQLLLHFPPVNGVICTSPRQNSIAGCDDLREVNQRAQRVAVWAPQPALDALTAMFPYVLPPPSRLNEKKSENQKLLWTAHLSRSLPALDDGVVHLLPGPLFRRCPLGEEGVRIAEDVAANRLIFDGQQEGCGGISVPPVMLGERSPKKKTNPVDNVKSNATGAAAVCDSTADAVCGSSEAKNKTKDDGSDNESSSTVVVEAPLPSGGVEMLSLSINENTVALAISLELDGRISAACEEKENSSATQKKRAVVYFPVAPTTAAGSSEQKQESIKRRLANLDIALAIVAWPSETTQLEHGLAELSRINESFFGHAERVVICSIPHFIPHLEVGKLNEMMAGEKRAASRTRFEMGLDSSVIFYRPL